MPRPLVCLIEHAADAPWLDSTQQESNGRQACSCAVLLVNRKWLVE
jgi:hypothetical protein